MPTSTLLPGKEMNPSQVSLGAGGAGPYINTGGGGSKVVGPETVRATGGGSGDAQWRQNLATFSGGQFARPGGSLNFNPLSNNPFGGAPTGGGNAPQMGMPSTLLQMALGGQPFSWNQPKPPTASPTPSGASTMNSPNDWLSQYMSQGNNFGNVY